MITRPGDDPFREPTESSPECAPLREPTEPAPVQEPTEFAHKAGKADLALRTTKVHYMDARYQLTG